MDTPVSAHLVVFLLTLGISVFASPFQRARKQSPQKEANRMAFYMAQGAYTAEALATMAKNPQDRSVPTRELVQKLGGRLIGFYFCFGEYDFVAIVESPDDTAAGAGSLAAASAGHLKAIKTTKLFSVEEGMEMMRKAGSVTFQAPSPG